MRALLFLLAALPVLAGEPDPESLIDNGHWKRARGPIEAGYQAHPNDARWVHLLGRVRHEFGKLDDAVKYAEMAVHLDPKTSAYHRELGEAYADQAEHVNFLKQIGYARKIRAEFDNALALAPKDPDNLFDRMLYYLQAPGVAGGDKKKAAEVANDLLKIDPARGYLALARIAAQQKEDGKLEGFYQKAVESNPRSYGARTTLANFYLGGQQPNFGLAEQHARAALDLNPDRIGAYNILVIALVRQKRLDDAAKLLARAEAAIPDDFGPYLFAARAMLRDGVELPKAETYLKKYFSQEPEADAPKFPVAHWSLGLVYDKEGRKTDARAELETALKLKPDFEAAKRDLKRMK